MSGDNDFGSFTANQNGVIEGNLAFTFFSGLVRAGAHVYTPNLNFQNLILSN